ncbi:hypothetical protein OCAR_5606 [Afipia carboxidovorans OM5]|nr:hypothetical protein OCAR_5606 [Afipia carboxidovorans OM5]
MPCVALEAGGGAARLGGLQLVNRVGVIGLADCLGEGFPITAGNGPTRTARDALQRSFP